MAATAALLSIPNANPKPKPLSPAFKSPFSHYTLVISLKSRSYPSLRLRLRRSWAAVQEAAVTEGGESIEAVISPEETEYEEEGDEKRRKLYVANLPWSLSGPDIQKLFSECGRVKDVEIIKQKDGRSRGYAFITMASAEQARTVVQKFNSYELNGRTIKVEFAKRFRKPPPPAPPGGAIKQESYKIYVSNLAWKARATDLREFFEKFKLLSARVVFETLNGRSAGYGFVGFATEDQALSAIAELDGKELMGRAVRLKMSHKDNETPENETSESETEEIDDNQGQSDES